ncbi:hypothetical protein P879_03047 [Paragonimus westermani]|uniref:G-protein coupled receptors family 1 profile domain-containing protein n=1 Tax=Paragonimus westermani TaxID=34504 RepID=A0A8T0DYD3_9TREM|nr:hypothetical protein P879_03047 [Paragonimus westermani]
MSSLSNSSFELQNAETPIYLYSYWKYTCLGILLIPTVVLTITGNCLVVLAVLRERHMRANLTNRFLVSLAVADLLMGSVVMPFAVFHTMHYGDWAFGRDWCDIWHAFDVLSSTASILNLCAIAVERFWATENPISYASRKTRHRCTVMLIGVWICSLIISFPAVAWWRRTEDYIADDSRTCRFTTDQLYLIVSSLVSFYIPFIVMTSVYAKIYNTASNLIKSLQTGEKLVPYTPTKCNPTCDQNKGYDLRRSCVTSPGTNYRVANCPSIHEMMVLRVHRGGTTKPNVTMYLPKTSICGNCSASVPTTSKLSACCGHCLHPTVFPRVFLGCCFKKPRTLESSGNPPPEQYLAFEKRTKRTSTSFGCCVNPKAKCKLTNANIGAAALSVTANLQLAADPQLEIDYSNLLKSGQSKSQLAVARLVMRNNPDINQSRSKQWMNKLRLFAASSRVSKCVREQKAAKTLGLVMGLFVCCWLPFFICNVIVAFRPELAQSSDSFQNILLVVTWLGYVNSGINPIIYAHSMREFRRAFKRLLCTWWWLSWTRGPRSRSRQFNHHYIHQVRGPRVHKFPANMDLRLIKPDLADPIAIASNWSHHVQPQSLYSLQPEPHAATRSDRGNQSHSENYRLRRCHCHSVCELLRTPKQINPSSTSGPPSLVKVTQQHSSPQTSLNLKLSSKLQTLPYPVGSASHLMIQQPVRELGRKCNSCMWTETYF